MSRRISVVGVAVAASSLALGVGMSSAKTTHHKKKSTPPPAPTTIKVKSTCTTQLSIAVPADATVVLADQSSGTMYGPINCKGIGKGIVSFPFTLADSGDTVGNMTVYMAAGSVTGAVDLTETDSQAPTPYDFGSADFTGTLGKLKGTGAYAGVSGSGAFTSCTTIDSIHYSCKLSVKGTLPAPTS